MASGFERWLDQLAMSESESMNPAVRFILLARPFEELAVRAIERCRVLWLACGLTAAFAWFSETPVTSRWGGGCFLRLE